MKIVIIGGVAAGASAAARLRRLDESAQILLLEKGGFISYANCGLPYHLGGVIPERDDLLVMSPERFSAWLKVEVRTRNEVTAIDRTGKKLTVQTPEGVCEETYDKLLIATGAVPQGSAKDQNGRVLNLWTLADMDRVVKRLEGARSAVIVGAGFIGLETAENLCERGLDVTIIQRSGHVLPTMDPEMAGALADELASLGVDIRFNASVAGYEETPDAVKVKLQDGSELVTDFVIESIGVRPNSGLAKDAGLDCGERGHIIVNEFMQTSDPDIFAAGDVVEVRDPVFGGSTAIPLAGPANKQGRIAAANLLGGKVPYKGSFGTSVVKVGHLTAGAVGYTEARLKTMKREYRKIYLHPAHHASYYPGASRMTVKLLFGNDGTIYGAQIVGAQGADKRIDAIAQAMRNGLKAPELGELELAYAPPYSSAKDPVNYAGFIAENVLSGVSDTVTPDTIAEDDLVLDVREPEEHELGAVPNSINIPLGELRGRLGELKKEKRIVTCCQVGLRGYLAERILKQNGFRAANLSGGFLTWKMYHHKPLRRTAPSLPKVPAAAPSVAAGDEKTLDVRGLPCPGPVLKLKSIMGSAPGGTRLRIKAARSFEPDLRSWTGSAACDIVSLTYHENDLEALLLKKEGADAGEEETPVSACAAALKPRSAAIVLFSNDLDKALAAMILANGLAASGVKVGIFFTFWGLSVLRKNPAPALKKDLVSRMFGWMLPNGAQKLALSKMNMMGLGSAMMKDVMKKKNVLSLPELIRSAKEAGVRFIACEMAMDVMGLTREELSDVDEIAGVATFAELAKESGTTLFI